MRMFLAVAGSIALSGCTAYRPYVALGVGGRFVNGESGLATCAEFGQQVSERTTLSYEHCSNLMRGRPVDDREDTSHDAFLLKHTFGGQPK